MRSTSIVVNISALLLVGFLFSNTSLAQSSTIVGTIIDSIDRLPLHGARVYLKSSNSVGDVTDIDGKFLISGVPLGKQVIVVSYLSYTTQEIILKARRDRNKILEIELSPESILGETIITGQKLGQIKAINQQLESETLANIVSSYRFQGLPDASTAEAISSLPGVAINRSGGEGQKVVIRGMQPKFTAIMINGIRLSSNSESDRSVDLSLFSPELLDGIDVFKSPLPDRDAESLGGAVDLRLRKAPKGFKMLAKTLGGYNVLNSDPRDNKEILQFSNRLFNDKIGFVAQGSFERFNRGVDFVNNKWRQGSTTADGMTQIFGSSLSHTDRQEKRIRHNAILGLDMNVGKGNIAFLGLHSQTSRKRFSMQENYYPSGPEIDISGNDIENNIRTSLYALQGEHPLGKLLIDWNAATTQGKNATPYDFTMSFCNNGQLFSPDLNLNAHPSTFYNVAQLDLPNSFLKGNVGNITSVGEKTNTAALNLRLPYKVNDNLNGFIKVGGKYTRIVRERNVDGFRDESYFLGGKYTRDATAAYFGEIIRLEQNEDLISYSSFDTDASNIRLISEEGDEINLQASIDPQLMREWYDAQNDLVSNERTTLIDHYKFNESITAAYAMLKFELYKKISIIPGLRYEYSDNRYDSESSTVIGQHGINSVYGDSTSFQRYGEFLPHLHIKYQILEWLDLRASYSTTLSRPDYTHLASDLRIRETGPSISTGKQSPKHSRSTNYDVFLSAYKGKFGLLSFGVYYKKIGDVFYLWQTRLFDTQTAAQFGFQDRKEFDISSFVNFSSSTVRGFEVDLQTNLRFLPGLFKGFVFNLNYARLHSDTETFFITSETRLVRPYPPLIETVYKNNSRRVFLPNQAPHLINMSLGYEMKGFSVRFTGSFQGSKTESYSTNKDFDRFTKSFWRLDASIVQEFGLGWSAFVNMNNITNQKNISYIRNLNHLSSIETYGSTFTGGIQYAIR